MVFLGVSMLIKLMLGFPFMIVLLGSTIMYLYFYMPGFNTQMVVQQVMTAITPPALVAIPMFVLGANILTTGNSAKRLVNMIKSFLGHMPGGLAITTSASCTFFGAVSGSTQATVAAIGGTMRPMLREGGYSSPFSLGLIINSSDIAFLIPPSIGFIVYGVATRTSIGALFLAGILPGLLILLLFSAYCYFYAKKKNAVSSQKASWAERKQALKEGLPVLGFPLIIMGGIYSGIFSPTEASAVAVAYALLVEGLIFKTLKWDNLVESFLQTGLITGVTFILVGAGQTLSFLLSFLRIPQQVLTSVIGPDPTYLQVVIVVIVAYFIACMFVDPIVAILVLSPVFAPYVATTGIDPILLGVLVVLQAAIGSATPPFGCDIFTAQVIFQRPYLEVIANTPPFILILILVTVLLVAFPQISLFIPNSAMF